MKWLFFQEERWFLEDPSFREQREQTKETIMSHTHSRETHADEAPAHTLLSLTSTAQNLSTSATLAMNEAVAKRRAAGRETIHLGFGEAAFPLHPLLKTALAEAATCTSYAPVFGIPALRQAIAAYLTRTRGVPYCADQIVVGPGSKALLYALVQILEGDILLPIPSWVSYAPMAHLASRRVIGVQTEPDDQHRLTPQALSQAMTQARQDGANPRILLVNTPSNPTGSMFERTDVEALALWAREAGVTLISDEIYAELAHGWREHVSAARFYPEGCIVTGGLSKAFSAGGWRLGYAALPSTAAGNKAMSALRSLASEVWSATATPLQEAALAAFTPNSSVEHYVQRSALVHGYVARQLYDALTHLGVPCPRPAGGFYLYPDFSPWRAALLERGIKTSQELAHYLLEVWDIATLPGSVFNEEPLTLHLRLSTSLLCEPEHVTCQEEREAALWHVLDQAEELQSTGGKGQFKLLLPALQRAQARWAEVIHELETHRASHQIQS
jgi:aspartate/methionine/tyrosine aminotransferase